MDANGLPVPRRLRAAITAYRLALTSLVCGIVPLGLGLIPIVSHKFSGFFLFGLVPAVAAIFIGVALRRNDDCDKRTSRIAGSALLLGILGLAVVAWAAGGRGGDGGGV